MYNQQLHQFDEFYNHKFGFHINGPHKGAFEAVFDVEPRIVKTLDFSVEILKRMKAEIPDLFLIGRLFVFPQDFGQLTGGTIQIAQQRGREMAEKILREEINQDIHHLDGKPLINAWESLNEVFPESASYDTHGLYNEYQIAFGEKMLAEGFEPIAFNFSQGNGSGPQWLELYSGTLELFNILGFHEYDWPTMDRLHQIGLNGPVELHNHVPGGLGQGNDGMWRALRYRRIMNNGIRQKYKDKHTVIITECGMTQGVWGGPSLDIGPWAKKVTVPPDIPGGVASSPISVDDYWQSLLWYNQELMQDDYVMGACLFVTGATGKPEWETFEHLGPIMDRIKAMQQKIPLKPLTRTPIPPLIEDGTIPTTQPAVMTNSPPSVQPVSVTIATAPAEPTVVAEKKGTKPTSTGGWQYTIEYAQGLSLLVGDIGIAGEEITITKPNGLVDRLTSGNKPEFGRGGFETYAQYQGNYKIEFLGQQFEILLGGQFTKLTFTHLPQADAVQVKLSLRDSRTRYAIREKIFAQIEVTNMSTEPLSFGILGLLTDSGHFQTSWDNGLIQVGETFCHEDGLRFNTAGNHTLQLSICFANKELCLSGNDQLWYRFEPKLSFIVE